MTTRRVHPAVFLVLILPFGVMNGFLTVSLAWLLRHIGFSVGQIAGLVALSFVPHTWKFLWAPVADLTLTRKSWYVIAGGVSAIGIFFMGAVHADRAVLPLLSLLVLTSNVAVTFLGMSVESLMAYTATEQEKGRAGGWFQAGNLGGSGLGGGAGLWMAQHLEPHWVPGALLGAACFLCCAALFFVPEPAATHRRESLALGLADVTRDLWSVARARRGFLALVLCFLPIGSGAASGLWSAVAGDWRASANAVALATGLFAGVISAVGCVAGGWLCDRMDRKWAYVLYGALQAACAVAMALTPRTQMSYILFTSLYSFITGLTYAGFSAFVLEAMGLGAAATKYNVFASLSNMPIMVMTSVDGWAHGLWGPRGMLYTEAACGLVGLLLFSGVMAAAQRRRAVPA